MKRLFIPLLTFCLLLAELRFAILSVNADDATGKEGYLSYKITNNEVVITACDIAASGDFYIPDKIAGYPVTSIGPSVFYTKGEHGFITSVNISNLYIPESIINIDREAFDACGIKNIYVDEHNPKFSSYDGMLYDKNKTTLIKCPSGFENESYTIPDFVENIGEFAFQSVSGIKHLTISDNVKKIGDCAFFSCCLETVSLGKGKKEIGSFVFDRCRYLRSVVIDGVETIGRNMFSSCENLTDVNIGNSVKHIEDEAFNDCKQLTHITIPNSVKTIGDNVFRGSRLWHIFYTGTEKEWKQIKQADVLCTIHFNSSDKKIACSESNQENDKAKFIEECLICSAKRSFHYSPPTLGIFDWKEHDDLEIDCVSGDCHCIDEWEEIIKAPTCTETGIAKGSCSYYGCGGSGEIEIPITDHEYKITKIAKNATPNKFGIKVLTCSGCGQVKREKYKYEDSSNTNTKVSTEKSNTEISTENSNNSRTQVSSEKSSTGIIIGVSSFGIIVILSVVWIIAKRR